MNDESAMDRALALALQGWGRVAPNPLVGAVLLRDGTVIGEGCHAEFGGPHAEVAALSAAGNPRGATCVVTLEPCNHHGKTPPCTEALIAARVDRVVVAVRDPSAEAAGGIERLRQAGLDVRVGMREAEAAALNAAFLCSVARPDRPFVAAKVATSLDGYIADAEGRSRWLSGEAARDWVHWLRAGFDAIAVGRRTMDRDDPQLTARGTVTPRVPPARVIFAASGAVRPDRQVVRSAHDVPTLVVTDPPSRALTEQRLAGTGVTVVPGATPETALAALRGRGIRSLLVEGGGDLIGGLLERDLIDRVYWVQTPRWLGQGVPAFGVRRALPLGTGRPWTVVERGPLGADTLLVVDREPCLPAS